MSPNDIRGLVRLIRCIETERIYDAAKEGDKELHNRPPRTLVGIMRASADAAATRAHGGYEFSGRMLAITAGLQKRIEEARLSCRGDPSEPPENPQSGTLCRNI